MISKYINLKQKAIELRKMGESIRSIEIKLKIPRSTLSGWFKNIKLTENQILVLTNNYKNALAKARNKALAWHHKQKHDRLETANQEALKILRKINHKNKGVMELSLAMLYLGEGDKTMQTSMGSANILILKFFIKSLTQLFNIKMSEFKCELHLRSDQDEQALIKYWANNLNLPIKVFKFYKDKRTVKSKSYQNYKGVCVVRCGKIAIQRRLVNLAQEYCKIADVSMDP